MNKLLFIFASVLVLTATAQTFEFSPGCSAAYQKIFQLRLNEASAQLAQLKKSEPQNRMPEFLENYIDFFKVYISENETAFAQMKTNVEDRLEKLGRGNAASPYLRYTQAEVHLQYALCKVKFGEYVGAVFEVKKAYALLQENQQLFPAFKPNLKSLGLLHTLFGAIPDSYKFGAKILGLKGSIEQGMAEMQQVIGDPQFQFRDEAVILYTLLQLHLQKKGDDAWQLIEQANLPYENNMLNCFIAASVAQHTGQNDKVIDIIRHKPAGTGFYPVAYLDFMLGVAKLNRLDGDANVYLARYINQHPGRSYKKEAFRKLAWFHLLNGNGEQYKKYMQSCLKFPHAATDEDKSAQKEAERGITPDGGILKARVLFDGGYYDKALLAINAVDPGKFTRSRDKVEYPYRKARILDEMGKTAEAVKAYLNTIQLGSSYDYYFAANAALKLAGIFERQGKTSNAITYYQMALNLDKDEYTNSINAEAKAGLNRLGE